MGTRTVTRIMVVGLLVVAGRALALEESGLILSGVDTMGAGPFDGGIDFVLQRPCTSATDADCHAHIDFEWHVDAYYLAIYGANGLFTDTGQVNLDSIKFAPPDAQMTNNGGYGLYRVFRIPPDSLSAYIGNVYVIKTGVDPRDKRPYYAKLKILDFNVIDAATHEVEMVFLWAVNLSGPTDLRTANLDTFDLTTVARMQRNDVGKGRGADAATWRGGEAARLRFAVSGSGVRVVGPCIVGRAERVWDLRGARVFTRRMQ